MLMPTETKQPRFRKYRKSDTKTLYELKAIIPPEVIAKAGTYIVTLKCEG
jgi:hypothetical protein